jgi:hypothetical protein
MIMSSEKPTESIVVNFPKTEHPAGGAQNGGSDDASEIAAQEKARLVMAEATRLANLAPGEWRVWIDRSAERFGVSRDTLEGLIVIKEQEKKQRELKAESRRQEQRVERQRHAAQREKEREQQQIQKDADRTTAQSATPKGARAVCSIDVDAITVPPDRMRKLRPEVVDNLAESIAGRGLIQAIVVKRRGAAYELVRAGTAWKRQGSFGTAVR